jgi:predicted ABC-type sugar transport system permease subunit
MHLSVFWVKVTQGLIILLAMFIDAQRVRIRTLAQKTNVRESKDNAIGS